MSSYLVQPAIAAVYCNALHYVDICDACSTTILSDSLNNLDHFSRKYHSNFECMKYLIF